MTSLDTKDFSIERLDLLLRRPVELPTPPVMVSLLTRFCDASFDEERLGSLILLDPITALNFIRANGIAIGMEAGKDLGIRSIVSRLGQTGMRQYLSRLNLSSSVKSAIPNPEFEYAKFSRHSRFISQFCLSAASKLPNLGVSPERAATAGLLHNIGTLYIAEMAAPLYCDTVRFAKSCAVSFDIGFACQYNKTPYDIGVTLSQRLGLSAQLEKAMGAFDETYLAEWPSIGTLVRIGSHAAVDTGIFQESWVGCSALNASLQAVYDEHIELISEAANTAFQAVSTAQQSARPQEQKSA